MSDQEAMQQALQDLLSADDTKKESLLCSLERMLCNDTKKAMFFDLNGVQLVLQSLSDDFENISLLESGVSVLKAATFEENDKKPLVNPTLFQLINQCLKVHYTKNINVVTIGLLLLSDAVENNREAQDMANDAGCVLEMAAIFKELTSTSFSEMRDLEDLMTALHTAISACCDCPSNEENQVAFGFIIADGVSFLKKWVPTYEQNMGLIDFVSDVSTTLACVVADNPSNQLLFMKSGGIQAVVDGLRVVEIQKNSAYFSKLIFMHIDLMCAAMQRNQRARQLAGSTGVMSILTRLSKSGGRKDKDRVAECLQDMLRDPSNAEAFLHDNDLCNTARATPHLKELMEELRKMEKSIPKKGKPQRGRGRLPKRPISSPEPKGALASSSDSDQVARDDDSSSDIVAQERGRKREVHQGSLRRKSRYTSDIPRERQINGLNERYPTNRGRKSYVTEEITRGRGGNRISRRSSDAYQKMPNAVGAESEESATDAYEEKRDLRSSYKSQKRDNRYDRNFHENQRFEKTPFMKNPEGRSFARSRSMNRWVDRSSVYGSKESPTGNFQRQDGSYRNRDQRSKPFLAGNSSQRGYARSRSLGRNQLVSKKEVDDGSQSPSYESRAREADNRGRGRPTSLREVESDDDMFNVYGMKVPSRKTYHPPIDSLYDMRSRMKRSQSLSRISAGQRGVNTYDVQRGTGRPDFFRPGRVQTAKGPIPETGYETRNRQEQDLPKNFGIPNLREKSSGSPQQSKIPFSEEEDKNLRYGVQKFGLNFKEIRRMMHFNEMHTSDDLKERWHFFQFSAS